MTINLTKVPPFMPDETFPINVFFIREFDEHWHEHLEWIYIVEGSAQIQVDTTFITLHQGEFAFINSCQLHSALPLEDSTTIFAVVFNEALLRNNGLDSTEIRYFSPILSQRLQMPNFLNANEPITAKIREAFTRLIHEFETKLNGYELFIKAELFRIFGLIIRHYHPTHFHPSAQHPRFHDFTELLKYLREHYQSTITVKAMSELMNMSPNHFCKVFKKLTGKTLIEYLHIIRVNEAERLLTQSEHTIADIADEVGFGDITYFGRIFKKLKNQTPSQYKKSLFTEPTNKPQKDPEVHAL